MTLNKIIEFAKLYNIDFDKDIGCITSSDDELILDEIDQIGIKETSEGNKLVFIPFVHFYSDKDFELYNVIN